MTSQTEQTTPNPRSTRPQLVRVAALVAVVVGGVVTLGLQVLVPRALHPLFGSGTNVAAAVVASALAGLAIGYWSGGRSAPSPGRTMARSLGIAGLLLVGEGLMLRLGLTADAVVAELLLVPFAAILVGVPMFFLGTLSPLAIQALTGRRELDASDELATTGPAASVFALGTLANVAGGLASGFVLAPFVGLSLSLLGFGLALLLASAVLRLVVAAEPSPQPQAQSEDAQSKEAQSKETRSSVTGQASGTGLQLGGGRVGYLALAAYSGVASIALQVNASRMMASYFGPTTGLWAALLSVSLGGLAIGYWLGGFASLRSLPSLLPVVVTANVGWLLAATWMLSLFQPQAGLDFVSLIVLAALAFGPPFVLFGLESQILVGAVWAERSARGDGGAREDGGARGDGAAGSVGDTMASASASVFAVSSVGGVVGALLAIVYLVPLLGMSGLVRVFLVGYLLVLALVWPKWKVGMAGLALVLLVIPMPSWRWSEDDRLVVQREGRFQTIRVYTDDVRFIRFHLGPTYESEVVLPSGEPAFGYTRTVLGLAGQVEGRRVLIIGGAGHALARAFEVRGAAVTEVEIDPIVREVSDEVFGPLEGDAFVEDGRRFVTRSPDQSFDVVIIDAFAGPRYVPPHLTTREFFAQVERVLAPDGVMYMNIISAVSGPGSEPFQAVGATVADVFPSSGYDVAGGNVVLVGSLAPSLPASVAPIESDRSPNTDDKNPIDILLEFAR